MHKPFLAQFANRYLSSPRAIAITSFLVPLLFGFYSLILGADANWDLYNYHLYNPFAWFHGKLQIDMAPAGMQSYFNPVLDVPFYLMNTHLPSRMVGFLMGTLHGLMFVIVLGIARNVLCLLPGTDRFRVPILIALAGCLTGNFLSGLGNSMGDDTTALFILSGLWLLLANWDRLCQRAPKAAAALVGAGIVVGLGVGLKLTNAVYALAMCLCLLSYPSSAIARLRLSFLFGVGVLLGAMMTGGYWHFHMWTLFGNPLYPQFGSLFPSPLTLPTLVTDTRWRPDGALETLLWPIIFTLDPRRVSETPIRQVLWPVVYLLFWSWMVSVAARRFTGQHRQMDPRQRFVILFVATGYVAWMKMFSIYRYIVPVEVLTPLITMLLLEHLLSPRWARQATAWIVGVATAVLVAGGARTWGHEGWTDPLYHAELPRIEQPERTTVLISSRNPAWGWIATLFPPEVMFAQIESSFPESPAFNELMRARIESRGGPVFALVNGSNNPRAESLLTTNRQLDSLGLTSSEKGCKTIRWVVERFRLHAIVLPESKAAGACRLALRTSDERDLVAENHEMIAEAAPLFERNGFILDKTSCVPYQAGIGKGIRVFQWCALQAKARQKAE